jgi:uncharacterized protein (DUF983 family)
MRCDREHQIGRVCSRCGERPELSYADDGDDVPGWAVTALITVFVAILVLVALLIRSPHLGG